MENWGDESLVSAPSPKRLLQGNHVSSEGEALTPPHRHALDPPLSAEPPSLLRPTHPASGGVNDLDGLAVPPHTGRAA